MKSLKFKDPILCQEVARRTGLPANPDLPPLGASELDAVLLVAAELAMALPTHPLQEFQDILQQQGILEKPGSTEVERLVRQRIGQDLYRKSLVRYWKGRCAVTGVGLQEVLRASHAKPWAQCGSDAERLDVFNGFLLVANLDALFDRGLISFDDSGNGLVSPCLDPDSARSLGLNDGLRLRWITVQHQPYLQWHRDQVFQNPDPSTEPMT